MRRVLSLVIVLLMLLSMPVITNATGVTGSDAAQRLYNLGLFLGVGVNADGSRNFDLNRPATRAEAITMFVRLLGASDAAHSGTWNTPFTDVPTWAEPYVGYAFENGLTLGISATAFGSQQDVTASQYITFVLRALGYESEVHFEWDSAWTLSDSLGITDGRFYSGTNVFLRSDVAEISFTALGAAFASSNVTLAQSLIADGVFTEMAADSAGIATLSGIMTANAERAAAATAQRAATAGDAAVLPTGVTVSPATVTVDVNSTANLSANVRPTNATNRLVTWSSSNSSVATVSANGVVTGVAEGTATITATTVNGLTATSTVTVRRLLSTITLPNRRLNDGERQAWIDDYRANGGATANELEVIRLVNIERRSYGLVEVEFDEVLFMAARFFAQQANDLRGLHTGSHNFGPYATNPSAQHGASANVAAAFGANLGRWNGGNWFSSGTLAAESLVSGWMNSPGHRRYILSPEHRFIGVGQFPGGISYMFFAPERSGSRDQVPTSVTVTPTTASLNIGATQTLAATVLPANVADRSVTWTSSDTSIATVSSVGVVTARAAGTVTITATTVNGLRATSNVTVIGAPVVNVPEFEHRVFELTNAERRSHGLPDLIWDDQIAAAARAHSVDLATNRLMGHTGSDGSNVGIRLQRVGINVGTWAENVASHSTPESAVQAWMNSPGHRANILNERMTHLGVGFDNTSGNTRFTQKFTILPTAPSQIMPTSISVIPEAINLKIDTAQTIAATVLPANATDASVTWSSSDTSVATVTQTGVVTAHAAGTATITAQTANNLTATALVTVEAINSDFSE